MDKLEKAIAHINASISNKIDRESMISCIQGEPDDKWVYHVLTFFLETSVPLMHDIALSGVFTFEELYKSHLKWDSKGYANGETTEWIKEMCYLEMGRAHELGIARFI